MCRHNVAPSISPPEGGQGAFTAIAEIVVPLENDPSTNGSRVDIDGLREHLVDMNELTLRTEVSKTRISGGIEFLAVDGRLGGLSPDSFSGTSSPPMAYPSAPLFASRLNSMGARVDLWSGEDAVLGWVARQGQIRGLDLVDFNCPQHLEGLAPTTVREAVTSASLLTGAVCTRFTADFENGAFTNPDPEKRSEAIDLALHAAEWARELEAKELVVWSAYDGYDYAFQADYRLMWRHCIEAFRTVCDAFPDLKVSLEPKPTEPRRFFIHNTAGAALLMVRDIERDNMGLTLDFGHGLMAAENPAQSAALAGQAGKLFGVQLNDGFVRPGCEDGLALGTVHPTMTLEFIYWLQRSTYEGHIYFDTFPKNEDPVREAEYNIRQFRRWWRLASRLTEQGVAELLAKQDTMGVLELLEAQ